MRLQSTEPKRTDALAIAEPIDLQLWYEPEEMGKNAGLRDALTKVLQSLTPREERVLRLRFLDGATLEEVADEFDLSRERIRQIEKRAIRKIKHPTRKGYLADYAPCRTRQKFQQAKRKAREFVWEPPGVEFRARIVTTYEPFDDLREIVVGEHVFVRFGDNVIRRARVGRIITGEKVCDEWQTDAVIAFHCDGAAFGERWQDVMREVRTTIEEPYGVSGRWRPLN